MSREGHLAAPNCAALPSMLAGGLDAASDWLRNTCWMQGREVAREAGPLRKRPYAISRTEVPKPEDNQERGWDQRRGAPCCAVKVLVSDRYSVQAELMGVFVQKSSASHSKIE